MVTSEVLQGGVVKFPEFRGERVYMVPFTPEGLPVGLSRWQLTVDQMLAGISYSLAFLMVDQAIVEPGSHHRRPGLHVDGYWHADGHGPRPGHGGHRARGDREWIVLASDVYGCDAYVGNWAGDSQWDGASGGDCSHVDAAALARVALTPGVAWLGETGALLHASVPQKQKAARTLVRVNACA